MNPFLVTSVTLAPLFGVADETGTIDETTMDVVNQRLDRAFHLATMHCRELVVISRGELDKLVGLVGWEAHALKLTIPEFNPADDGIPDEVVNLINKAPEHLAQNARGRADVIFIQTPMYGYRKVGRKVKSEVWTRIVIPVVAKARRSPVKKTAKRVVKD